MDCGTSANRILRGRMATNENKTMVREKQKRIRKRWNVEAQEWFARYLTVNLRLQWEKSLSTHWI